MPSLKNASRTGLTDSRGITVVDMGSGSAESLVHLGSEFNNAGVKVAKCYGFEVCEGRHNFAVEKLPEVSWIYFFVFVLFLHS